MTVYILLYDKSSSLVSGEGKPLRVYATREAAEVTMQMLESVRADGSFTVVEMTVES